jgi:hypothetical protein
LACHNTFTLQKSEFAKLQRSEDGKPKKVVSPSGKEIEVTRDSKIFVRSERGRRYPITPFNFGMTSSQLVAPDRDYILMTAGLKTYEVDVPSPGKTIALVGGGLAVVAGVVVVLFLTSGSKTFGD